MKQGVLTSRPFKLLSFCLEHSAQENLSWLPHSAQVSLISHSVRVYSQLQSLIWLGNTCACKHACTYIYMEGGKRERETENKLFPSPCLHFPFLALSIGLFYILHLLCLVSASFNYNSCSPRAGSSSCLVYLCISKAWKNDWEPQGTEHMHGKEASSANSWIFGFQYCGLWCPWS